MYLRDETGRDFASLADATEAVDLSAGHPGSAEHALAVADSRNESKCCTTCRPGRARADEAVDLAVACGSTKALTYALSARVMARWGVDRRGYRCCRRGAGAGRGGGGARLLGIHLGRDQGMRQHGRPGQSARHRVSAPQSRASDLARWAAHLRRDALRDQRRLRLAPARRVACLRRTAAGRTGFDTRAGARYGRPADLGPAGMLARPMDRGAGPPRPAPRSCSPSCPATRSTPSLLFGPSSPWPPATPSGRWRSRWPVCKRRRVRPTLVERLIPLAARATADEVQARRDRGDDPAPAVARLLDLQRRFPKVVAEEQVGPMYTAQVCAMQALYEAELLRGQLDPAAAAAWSRAAQACIEAELRWDEAYAQWRAAQTMLADRSTRDAAVTALRRAHQLAVDLQAAPLLADIEALARSGCGGVGQCRRWPAPGHRHTPARSHPPRTRGAHARRRRAHLSPDRPRDGDQRKDRERAHLQPATQDPHVQPHRTRRVGTPPRRPNAQ